MNLMVRWSVLAIALLAGCPAADDDVDTDGGVDSTQLTITWSVVPAVPGPVATGLTVRELHIAYSSVRLIGDAAPGDARTTAGYTELEWDEVHAPPPIGFPAAPPGRYSTLDLGVGGGNESFAIHGTVDVRGTPTGFEIEDEAPNPVSLALAFELRPGASATIALEVDLAPVLALVPFEQLPTVAGEVTLHRGDARMIPVRAAMAAAVKLAAASIR